jgi:hypothetical protein
MSFTWSIDGFINVWFIRRREKSWRKTRFTGSIIHQKLVLQEELKWRLQKDRKLTLFTRFLSIIGHHVSLAKGVLMDEKSRESRNSKSGLKDKIPLIAVSDNQVNLAWSPVPLGSSHTHVPKIEDSQDYERLKVRIRRIERKCTTVPRGSNSFVHESILAGDNVSTTRRWMLAPDEKILTVWEKLLLEEEKYR